MKISPIVLKLRAAETVFGDEIAGIAEMDVALNHPLKKDIAFVLQLSEDAKKNEYDTEVSQIVNETFGVVVALMNDTSQADKTGLTAYDKLHDIRQELWDSLLGWLMPEDDGYTVESQVEFKGGRILGTTAATLWYRYDFGVNIRINQLFSTADQEDFDSLYNQFILSPSDNLPVDTPSADLLPTLTSIVDMSTIVDLTEDLDAGGFSRGFAIGFETYTGY